MFTNVTIKDCVFSVYLGGIDGCAGIDGTDGGAVGNGAVGNDAVDGAGGNDAVDGAVGNGVNVNGAVGNGAGGNGVNGLDGAVSNEGGGAVYVLSFNTFPPIDLRTEISGTTDALVRLCGFSEAVDGTVFCGVRTRVADEKRISVAVCHKGTLVDIPDRTMDGAGGLVDGAAIKIFSTGTLKIALLIDTDALNPKYWENVSGYCDLILNLTDAADAAHDAAFFADKHSLPLLLVHNNGVFWHSKQSD